VAKKRANKYNAKKVIYDGITFDSKDEGDFYLYLKEQKKAGAIQDFKLQPEFELQPKFTKKGKTWLPIKYKADFLVFHNDGTTQVIDVKGFETADFKLKKKMFEYKFPESLTLICRAPKYLAPRKWIELDELAKVRKERKKQQKGESANGN
jgi:hypothetical protein